MAVIEERIIQSTALFCSDCNERITPKFQDDTVRDEKHRITAGGEYYICPKCGTEFDNSLENPVRVDQKEKKSNV